MEKTIGAPDLTLLQKLDEEGIVNNLKKRFEHSLVYTSIGSVILSVNPYRKLDIYGNNVVQQYQKLNSYELPPHV